MTTVLYENSLDQEFRRSYQYRIIVFQKRAGEAQCEHLYIYARASSIHNPRVEAILPAYFNG